MRPGYFQVENSALIKLEWLIDVFRMCLNIMKMVYLTKRKENFLALIGLVIIPQFGFHIKAQKARLLKFWARMFLISLVHTKMA